MIDAWSGMEEGSDNDKDDSLETIKSKPHTSRKSEEITFLAGEACLYSVIKRSALSLGWKLVGEDASERVKRNCHVIWVDRSFVNDKLFLSIQPWQRINHFPGMTNICRKARLAQSLELMKKKFPREFSFYPATYVLPQSIAMFKTLFSPNGQSKGTFIIKPDGSAQGKGIFLTRRLVDVENLSTVCVAQQYIRNPLLIEKKKFDLRIYVLVTSCSPLRLYLFRDGLVRICTEEYKRPNTSNMADRCMHLTNYSVNKRSEKYERDKKGSAPSNLGSKRSISWLMAWLSEEKSAAAANKMWSKIGDICVMTVISILPILRREYSSIFEKNATEPSGDHQQPRADEDETKRKGSNGKSRCFEILGFDIMVDRDLRPSLIEVNHLPSWGTDSPIDEDIKSRVITQALSAMNVNALDKKCYESAKRKQSRLRLRRRHMSSFFEEAIDENNQPRGSNQSAGVRRPALFDSNSAERRVRLVYEKHAPEKLSKVKDLLNRYRGYEEWLVKKIEDKYSQNDDDSSSSSDDEDSSSDGDSIMYIDDKERKKFEEEERILRDYDRIYPPRGNGRISLAKYREMEKFVTEMDEKQQQRLTCPLQQMRPNNGDGETELNGQDQSGRELNRGEGWIGGNIHIRSAKEEAKITGPPTKKQIEFADRLSRGYSVEDTEVSEKSIRKKYRMLHHDFLYEEDNPFYHLIDRVKQSRELSKQVRRRAEKKLNRRSLRCGALVKQQVLQLGVEIPFIEVEENNSKFYAKRRGMEECCP